MDRFTLPLEKAAMPVWVLTLAPIVQPRVRVNDAIEK